MNRGAMIGWIVVLVLIATLFLSIFPTFASDVNAMKQMIAGYPPAIQAAFGFNIDTLFTFLGFYAYIFTYLTLAGAIQATNLGLSILSRENRSKTTDFLLTKPITRQRVFGAKLLAALSVILITNIVLVGATLALAFTFGANNFSLRTFGLLAIAFLIVQLIFLAIGIFVSQLMRVKSVVSISLGITLGFFALGMLQSITNDDKLRYLTPFKYFDHLKIVTDRVLEAPFIWLSVGLVVVVLAVGFIRYTSRDVRSTS